MAEGRTVDMENNPTTLTSLWENSDLTKMGRMLKQKMEQDETVRDTLRRIEEGMSYVNGLTPKPPGLATTVCVSFRSCV